MDYKAEFLEIFESCVQRNGKERLLEWLTRPPPRVFTAPVSAVW